MVLKTSTRSTPVSGKIGTIESGGTIYAVYVPNRTDREPYLEKIADVEDIEVKTP